MLIKRSGMPRELIASAIQCFSIIKYDARHSTAGQWSKFQFNYIDKNCCLGDLLESDRTPCSTPQECGCKREFGFCTDTPTHVGKLRRVAGHPFCFKITRNYDYPGEDDHSESAKD